MTSLRNATRSFLLITLAALFAVTGALPADALPTPSKTAEDQSLEARQADLATLSGFLEQREVQDALAQQGLTADEVNQRLAELSPQELSSLAGQVDQVQAAGVYIPTWAWIVIVVALAALIIAVA
ncbi:MAG TPA: PA2779 family protein [Thermoanaerobaculia bacterium]|nr:PA2779 family protein [Thermoanaerobaculia bacterium]